MSNKSAAIGKGVDILNIDTKVPTVGEVKQAIKLLTNGKTPGIDKVYADMPKAEEFLTPRPLTDIQ